MVKTTREGENLRRSSRFASFAGTWSKEEEQIAPQIFPPGSMKGDTSVDPTERPDSEFMIPSKQAALTLVALAAAEDPGRQLPDSAIIASENHVACMKPTSTDGIASSSSVTSAYIAPARVLPLFSNEPALPQVTGEGFSPPVGSTDPQNTDAAPSAAASPPGNPRGSDSPTGDACESTSGTRGFRTASMYEATLGTHMLGEICGPTTSKTEEDFRGRDRSRSLDGTTAGAPGGALGRCTTSFGNLRGTDAPSGGGAPAKGSAFEEPELPSTRFFLEQRPDPCSWRPDMSSFRRTSCYATSTKLSPSSTRQDVSHLGRAPPDFPSLSASLPHVPSSGYPQPASWADLARSDPLKVQDSHSLEMLRRAKGLSRIEGAAPARKVEEQEATPRPVSVEQDFAGEEPEPVEEDLTGGESGPSAEDVRDGLAQQDTSGLEHQVKIDQFQEFISILSIAERLRVLGLPNLHAVSSPVKRTQYPTHCLEEIFVPLRAKTLSMLHREIVRI